MYYISQKHDVFTSSLFAIEFGSAEPEPALCYFEPLALLNHADYHEKCYNGKHLVLNAHIGTWCFLTAKEYEILQKIDNITCRSLAERFPHIALKTMEKFLFHLYIRNVITINRHTFISKSLFEDSPLKKLGALFIVEPTKRCNLLCSYCFAGCNSEKQPVMSHKSAHRVIELILATDFDNVTIEFSGGEALLEFGFIQFFVKELNKQLASSGKTVNLTMQTNATLLDEQKLNFLLENDISFGFSLDGDEKEHNVTRKYPQGQGTYDDVAKAIRLTRSKGRSIGILSVLTQINSQNHLHNLRSYQKLGACSVKLNPIFPNGRAEENWQKLAISDSEILALQQQYLDYLVEETGPLPEDNLLQMINNLSTCMRHYRCMLSCCGAGENMFTFAPNGDIYPCARYQEEKYRLGHIDDSDLKLQNLYKANALISDMSSRKVADIEKCRICTYRRFCEGDCSLATYEAYGGWHYPHPRCDYYHGTYEQLFSYLSRHEELPHKLDANLMIFNNSFI